MFVKNFVIDKVYGNIYKKECFLEFLFFQGQVVQLVHKPKANREKLQ